MQGWGESPGSDTSSSSGVRLCGEVAHSWHSPIAAPGETGDTLAGAQPWATCCWLTAGEDLAPVPPAGWVMLHTLSPRSCKSHSSRSALCLPSVNG